MRPPLPPRVPLSKSEGLPARPLASPRRTGHAASARSQAGTSSPPAQQARQRLALFVAGRGRRRTGRLSLLKCASMARNLTRRKGATQPHGGQRRLALHQKPRQGGAPGWPLAQALISPLSYTLGMQGVNQLRVPFRTQGGRAVGAPSSPGIQFPPSHPWSQHINQPTDGAARGLVMSHGTASTFLHFCSNPSHCSLLLTPGQENPRL